MNNNMGLPKYTLPATDDELIYELGLDDGYTASNQEFDIEFRTSSNGIGDNQMYNSLGGHQPAQTNYYGGISPTGINNSRHVLDAPWDLFTNYTQESTLPAHNAGNQDRHYGSDINMLVEDLITDLDRTDEVLQDGYSGSNNNKVMDDIMIDHDMNSYMQTFNDVPAPIFRYENIQDNRQLMDSFLMTYQPTEIISYVDMSESGYENGLY